MLAQQNFGCGSSREHAVWALEDMGVEAIIAPSFGDIFRNNCSKVGLLTIQLDQDDVDYLMSRAEELPEGEIVINLENQTVMVGSEWSRQFKIDEFVKHRLLNGLDDIGITLANEQKISSFEEIRSSFLPSTDQAGQDSLKIN